MREIHGFVTGRRVLVIDGDNLVVLELDGLRVALSETEAKFLAQQLIEASKRVFGAQEDTE